MASNPDVERLLHHRAWLRRLATSLVGEAGEDLTQETWVAALQHPPDASRPARPWLASVVRRLAGRHWRREEQRSLGPLREPDGIPSTDQLIERIDTERRLALEVSRLKEPFRTVVILRFFEGLSSEEIARQLDVPAGTVRWRLKHGLDSLRERLDCEFGRRDLWYSALGGLVKLPVPVVSAKTSSAATILFFGGLTVSTLVKVTCAVAVVGALVLIQRLVVQVRPETAVASGGMSRTQEPEPAILPRPEAANSSGDSDRETVSGLPSREPLGETLEANAFRGLLVDAATGERIPDALLKAGDLEVIVDETGHFDSEHGPDPSVATIEFHDPHQGTHIGSIARREMEWTEEGWLAAIAIGPTFRLALSGAPELDPDDWRARLVETTEDGTVVLGDWQLLRVGRVSYWFRYDNPWGPNAEGSTFRIDVEGVEGTLCGSGSAHDAVGIHAGIVIVVIERELSTIKGRVIDTEGQPKRRSIITAVSVRASHDVDNPKQWHSVYSEVDGTFEFRGIEPGDYRIHVRPRRGETPERRRVDVPAGVSTLADFVLPLHEHVGKIAARLVSKGGLDLGSQLFRLRSIDGRGIDLVLRSGQYVSSSVFPGFRGFTQGAHGPEQFIEFPSVSAGDYELSVVSSDGYDWTPRTVRVAPPMDGLLFVREDDVQLESFGFEVRDAETNELLSDYVVQLQLGGCWNAEAQTVGVEERLEIPPGAPFRWSIRAAGYRPASGDRTVFLHNRRERIARVRLDPGWGMRLVLRDAAGHFDVCDERNDYTALGVFEREPVPGIEVWADGKRVAVSDAGGIATLALDAEPDRIEFVADGWTVVGSPVFRDGRIAGEAGEAVVWLARE